MIRVPHPVTVTQTVTASRAGGTILLAALLVICLHKGGCISATPEPLPDGCLPSERVEHTAAWVAENCP